MARNEVDTRDYNVPAELLGLTTVQLFAYLWGSRTMKNVSDARCVQSFE